jgi:hypothetical protein
VQLIHLNHLVVFIGMYTEIVMCVCVCVCGVGVTLPHIAYTSLTRGPIREGGDVTV